MWNTPNLTLVEILGKLPCGVIITGIVEARSSDFYTSVKVGVVHSIVDAVESTDDRDMQFEKVKTVLIDNGIIEIEESANEENREGKNVVLSSM